MDIESLMALARDVPAVADFLSSTGGRLVRRDDDEAGLYWAIVQPPDPARSPFVVRIGWTVYPHRPPSVLFALEVGMPTGDPRGWPAHAWRNNGNPFLFVVENIVDDINRVGGARAA